MSLKAWLDEYKYDEEYIYEGLRLDLSYYLKQFMLEKRINKKQLAEKMRVSPAYVTKIFSGQNISLKTVAKILSALQVDAGIRIINREKEYQTISNNSLLEIVKKGEENESEVFSTAA
jgi:transcriptional regulator with XRE-family HTH domain